ncbi:MAG TPA: hypothetical protein VJU59_09120 [Paraburkholderia sp.]|uniref:hypothetical protein n=1 Tax=Paraburkholderia sp. TaxID=1926495 RepID=UPI002B4A78CD|nr:hypothetical protein [Paraburkholderia sp.]HKR39825.1 hypothetical protein [Paraburkholderia sp.]
MWPTVAESRFAKNWESSWFGNDRDQLNGGTDFSNRGQRAVADDSDIYRPYELLMAVAAAEVTPRMKRAAPVSEEQEQEKWLRFSRRALNHDPDITDTPVLPEMFGDAASASVFAALADTVVSVAADPELAPRDIRFDGKANNAEGVMDSWSNAATRAERLKRDQVEVTRPDGVTERFRSVADAFKQNHLPMPKHIRFRGKLKQSGNERFKTDSGAIYVFRLVPDAA